MKLDHPRQQVELFHLLFLSQLGRKLDKKLYALKGGCNMRFYFNSIRYSEDIDLDVQTIQKETLYKNVCQILEGKPFAFILQSYGLEISNISAPKQTQTTQRWKVTLKTSRSALLLHTKIEFSRRLFNHDVQFEVINPRILSQYSLAPIMVNHYSMRSMYTQKIQALALRKETQARDIFDLYLMTTSGNDFKSASEESELISLAIENAKNVTFTHFKGQVLAYLPEDDQQQYDDELVWHHIVENVVHTLEEISL